MTIAPACIGCSGYRGYWDRRRMGGDRSQPADIQAFAALPHRNPRALQEHQTMPAMASAAFDVFSAPRSPVPRRASLPAVLPLPAALPRFLAERSLPSAPPGLDIPRRAAPPPRRVRFMEVVLVRWTWHPEDYDRTPGEDSFESFFGWAPHAGAGQNATGEGEPELLGSR
ncbi:hypothetical protein DFJ74DRAFT_667753 [Hyaloraphidium curvatum]|nr:hypothetical protein DFJ74DRAFT_667753 [Hyaloraphidium curvatum]